MRGCGGTYCYFSKVSNMISLKIFRDSRGMDQMGGLCTMLSKEKSEKKPNEIQEKQVLTLAPGVE